MKIDTYSAIWLILNAAMSLWLIYQIMDTQRILHKVLREHSEWQTILKAHLKAAKDKAAKDKADG